MRLFTTTGCELIMEQWLKKNLGDCDLNLGTEHSAQRLIKCENRKGHFLTCWNQNLHCPYLFLEKLPLERRTKTSKREMLGPREHYIKHWSAGSRLLSQRSGVPGGGCQEKEHLIR